jgi:thiosulfate/3-mercaptopyruvate sulfurtransferase
MTALATAPSASTAATDRRSQSLVSVDWARERLDDPQVRFLEVDVDTSAYETGHLPGAVGINWTTQLNDPIVRELASREQLETLLRDAGVNDDTLIVLYGDNDNWFAAWAYWQLKYNGLDNARLLNGGRKKVEAAGLPLTTDAPSNERGNVSLSGTKREDLRAYRDQVLAAIGKPGLALIDVRSPAEFSGDLAAPEHLPQERAQRKGHIPGAANVPWAKAVAEDGTFKSDDELTTLYGEKGIGPDKEVIAYCRIGERSSHTWFVLSELLGYPSVRNYDGSWTEYGSLVGVPIELGDPAA